MDLNSIVDRFDKATKLRFRNSDQPQFIKFGSERDNDSSCNIRFGRLKLLGSDVATFFEPSVDCIVKAVSDQSKVPHRPISHVVLVGGFATSDWLFSQVRDKLLPHGLDTIRPVYHANRTVSDGALSFYRHHFVCTLVSKFDYGIFSTPLFDRTHPDNQLEERCVSISGQMRLRDFFSVILPKSTRISESKEFRRSYWRESKSEKLPKGLSIPVWCYHGAVVRPKWKDIDTQNYTELCRIEFDFSQLPSSRRFFRKGIYYFNYDVVLLFGLIELKAMVAWKENGAERRSAAKIIYDPDPAHDDRLYL